ncbi:MAG: hypothetical protein ACR2L8_05650 [Solirubrobacteraceae bacterium]
MLARRLLLLAAVLMLLTALAAGIAPDPAPVEPPPATSAAPAGRLVELSLSAAPSSGEDQRVKAHVGDLIELEVSGDLLDTVQIERLDRLDPVEPTTPARFNLIAEEAGVYPIRLVEADRRIGRLDIRP